jgi:hypothetical protein
LLRKLRKHEAKSTHADSELLMMDEGRPFIRGLLKTLREPVTEWAVAARVKWLQTAANIFDLIYKGDGGGIVVTGARADRSPRPHDE